MEQISSLLNPKTIVAIATPPGSGGVAVIRVSGPDAISIVENAWQGKRLSELKSRTVSLGTYVSADSTLLDEALVTVFRAPRSFTGEDTVEIALHGSSWIQREVVADLIKRGASAAGPGEFTQRAFLNGRLDLAQAEGVADLIAASSKAAHQLAVSQTKGTFSRHLEKLRSSLIEFASLLELELDFSEEDVEFADRSNFKALADKLISVIDTLARSYASGNVLKNGVPVVIAGIPNAGKSSLLNLILNDDKAIVSDIPGTTRDTIEDTVEIGGILFRFIDTAGIRQSSDKIEVLGIERTRLKLKSAHIVIWMYDMSQAFAPQYEELRHIREINSDASYIILGNKIDLTTNNLTQNGQFDIPFSILANRGFNELKELLVKTATQGINPETEIIVTNARHYEALLKGNEALKRAREGIENGLSADFIAQDIRDALHHLGTITGAVTTSDLLQSIFTRFCIGK